MTLEEKVNTTENGFKKSLEVLEGILEGEEINKDVLKAAVTLMNNHVKLVNTAKGSEALELAKKRFSFDWSVAIADNKEELKQLLSGQK